jgi:hypothetical protein
MDGCSTIRTLSSQPSSKGGFWKIQVAMGEKRVICPRVLAAAARRRSLEGQQALIFNHKSSHDDVVSFQC